MSYTRVDQIYDRLGELVARRRCYDGSMSFGAGIDEDELQRISAEERQLLSELEILTRRKDDG